MKKEAGISLVEVLVTLAVAVMMIVAIVSVILVSLKNSQFAQNQSTATRYAQEAIDQIRSIRDRDGGITDTSGASLRTGCSGISDITKFSDLYCSDLGSSGYFLKLDNLETTPTLGLFNLANSGREDLGRGLRREIMIKDEESTAGEEKKVIVRVSWEDSSGVHESNLETILVNTR